MFFWNKFHYQFLWIILISFYLYTHEYQWRNAGMTVLSRRRSGLLWAFCWCAQDLRILARLVEKDFDLSPVLGQAQASVSAIS